MGESFWGMGFAFANGTGSGHSEYVGELDDMVQIKKQQTLHMEKAGQFFLGTE